MQSEKAKALAAEQKAAVKAEKLRKKNSDDPRDWGRTRQIIEAYKQTSKIDPQLNWITAAAIAGGAVLFTLLWLWWQPQLWWLGTLLGIAFGATAALYLLTWRVKKASYTKYEGQLGSAEVAFSTMDAKKWSYQVAVAGTRQMDIVHRVIGQAGIVLVGEGNPTRVKQLLATEAKRHEQVAYGVKVTAVTLGKEEGQVPLDKLAKHIEKLPKVLQPHQITDVKQRLKALDAVRAKAPIPRGPMPTVKGVRRSMRGR